ncbi:MAG: CCA tRNA nucleotidyltransferase [Pirellulales bacterium]|nr:CCA tRNA nucleotidyltransferase [Pirellulales bacterium]
MTMSAAATQRDFALDVVRKLRDSGYEAFWAGGCVRDELLGRMPKDYDVATSARPEQIRQLFGRRRTLAIGAAFGVISVLGGREIDPIEVATFRSDGEYHDGRHPQNVVFTTAEEDAERRDFTINGLFFDPIDEQVIDYVGGREDLRQGIVRAIGNPQARFTEDKLRMLRAVRFAATFGFQIEAATFSAIQTMAQQVHVVSAERIGSELRRILVHPQRQLGVQLLHDTGLLHQLMPEITESIEHEPETWRHTLQYLKNLETESLPVALASLLWETGDASWAATLGTRFRFTNKERERATWLIHNLSAVAEARNIPWPQLQQRLVHAAAGDLMALAAAVLGESHEGLLECRRRLQLPAAQLNPPLLLTGDDLVAHGLKPGRHFAALLEHIRNAQLEGQIKSREQALERVDAWIRQHEEK